MPLNNESFNKYLYKKVKAGGFDSPIKSKRIRTKMSFYIDEQANKDSDKPKKHKKRKVTEEHDLNDNSDKELD
jgi:hypothetical protein